jgi:hypothetical protein
MLNRSININYRQSIYIYGLQFGFMEEEEFKAKLCVLPDRTKFYLILRISSPFVILFFYLFTRNFNS